MSRAGRTARRAARQKPARDQDESSFVPILRALVARVPGAMAAAVFDVEGETVDYATERVDPFEVKIAAAQWRVVIADVAERARRMGSLRELIVRGAARSFIVRPLPDDYALVVMLQRRAGFTASARALVACERALSREAGWKRRPAHPEWFPVEVTTDTRRRPAQVSGAFDDGTKKRGQNVEVLGSLVGLLPHERGFRVRLATGIELNLVREAGGFWYGDEDV